MSGQIISIFFQIVLLLNQRHQHRWSLRVQWTRGHLRHLRPDRPVQVDVPLPAQHLRRAVRAVLSGLRAESVEAVQVVPGLPVRT